MIERLKQASGGIVDDAARPGKNLFQKNFDSEMQKKQKDLRVAPLRAQRQFVVRAAGALWITATNKAKPLALEESKVATSVRVKLPLCGLALGGTDCFACSLSGLRRKKAKLPLLGAGKHGD